jgi:hypothetical protein
VSESSKLDLLEALLHNGTFHHATLRTIGVETLWIYRQDAKGFRGYSLVTGIPVGDKDFEPALKMVMHTGVSVGAFGCG